MTTKRLPHKPHSYADAEIIDAEIIDPPEVTKEYGTRGVRNDQQSQLTPEFIEQLCTLAREGLHKTHIASICGCSLSNFKYWLNRAPDREPYRGFREKFRKAEAEFAREEWNVLSDPGLEDKFARKVQWRLEKRFPKIYGHRQTVEHNVNHGVNEEQLRQLAADNPAQFERYMKALQEQEAVEGYLLGTGDEE